MCFGGSWRRIGSFFDIFGPLRTIAVRTFPEFMVGVLRLRIIIFFLKFHKYFAYKRTLDGLKSRLDPLEF